MIKLTSFYAGAVAILLFYIIFSAGCGDIRVTPGIQITPVITPYYTPRLLPFFQPGQRYYRPNRQHQRQYRPRHSRLELQATVPIPVSNVSTVECSFKNTTQKDARVLMKITYYVQRPGLPNLTPLKRVSRSYLTIKAGTSQLSVFQLAGSSFGAMQEVVVIKGDVNYQCGFGRR